MVLVVGGAGYVGSHTLLALREAGREAIALDDLSRGHEWALLGAPLVRADVTDLEALRYVFGRHQVSAVLHFAGLIEVGESVKDPAGFYHANVHGTWCLLEAMREAGVRDLVFSSTAAVYGEPEHTPIPEMHPRNPTSPYGDTKLAAERLIQAYEAAYGFRAVRLRYFNAAGADPEGRLGEAHDPETHLIPRALLSVLGRGQFTVFGDDYPTPDGTCVRDYVHVCDLAAAHVAALDALRRGESGAFNLGTGRGASVREVVEAVRAVTGADFSPGVAPRRPGDPAVLVADPGLAGSVLGWQPQRSDLLTVVEDAWRWHRRSLQAD